MSRNQTYNLQLDGDIDYNKGLRLIFKYVKPYLFPFILISITLLIATILGNSILPQLLKRAIDIDITNKDLNGLMQTTLIFVGLAAIYLVLSYVRLFFTGKLGQHILFNIRKDLFNKIQTLPSKFFSDNQSGDIIQRLTGNVDTLNSFFSEGIIRLLDIVFSVIIILGSIFLQSKLIGFIALGGAFLMILYIIIQGRIIEKPISESLRKEGDMSANVQESLDGFVAIQSTNQQKSWTKGFEKKTASYYTTMKKVSLISAFSKAGLTFIGVIAVYALLTTSLGLYQKQIITIGTVILILSYMQDLLQKVTSIAEIWRTIKTGLASSERLRDVFELESDISTIALPYKPTSVKGNIEFTDVDFAYVENEKVLSDVNFEVKAGQTIAIVGPTGAGKTTFVNLIARLYDTDNGNIYLDGRDIKEWDLEVLRKNIGYLIQDTFLFEDTILNNLKYNNPKITEEQALQVFKDLGVESFIRSLPEGLETKISYESSEISAGQRQIIALARILLREPKILILDEATARIDTKSEKMLQNAIEKACEGKTTFIIAHRLSTIFNADQIILIKDNTILEKGTNKELLALKGLYFEMYSRFVGK
ncbi:ABC transporter ATP-binding protein/permease [Patescibacteria group bacterium]|nr:ABC transporter ATP-binding protein/permease [Patescibacteria group bacterium]